MYESYCVPKLYREELGFPPAPEACNHAPQHSNATMLANLTSLLM